jgi:hypothetical protein
MTRDKTKPVKRTRAGAFIVSTVGIPSIFGDYEWNVALLDERGSYIEEIGASHDKSEALRLHKRAVLALTGRGPEVRTSYPRVKHT